MRRLKFITSFVALLGFCSLQASEMPAAVKVGEKAPDFTLAGADNKSVSLSDFQGKPVALIFSRAHW